MLFLMSLRWERQPELKPEVPLKFILLSFWTFFENSFRFYIKFSILWNRKYPTQTGSTLENTNLRPEIPWYYLWSILKLCWKNEFVTLRDFITPTHFIRFSKKFKNWLLPNSREDKKLTNYQFFEFSGSWKKNYKKWPDLEPSP